MTVPGGERTRDSVAHLPPAGYSAGTIRRALFGLVGEGDFDALGLVGLALLVIIWQALTVVVPIYSLPPPLSVAHRIAADFFSAPSLAAYGLPNTSLFDSMLYTTSNVVLALCIGTVCGTFAGLVTARVPWIRTILDPVLLVAGTIPILVLAPFFLVWFGTGRISALLLVIIYSAVILYVYAQRAAENLDPVYEDGALMLGASRSRIIRDVLVPGTVPQILGGIRIALAGAWGLQAIAELLGSQHGIGKLVQVWAGSTDIEGIFAALLVLAAVAVVFDLLVGAAVMQLTLWNRPSRASAA